MVTRFTQTQYVNLAEAFPGAVPVLRELDNPDALKLREFSVGAIPMALATQETAEFMLGQVMPARDFATVRQLAEIHLERERILGNTEPRLAQSIYFDEGGLYRGPLTGTTHRKQLELVKARIEADDPFLQIGILPGHLLALPGEWPIGISAIARNHLRIILGEAGVRAVLFNGPRLAEGDTARQLVNTAHVIAKLALRGDEAIHLVDKAIEDFIEVKAGTRGPVQEEQKIQV